MKTSDVVVDASRLPDWAFGWRTPLWWGMLLLIVILVTLIFMMLGSYFFLAASFEIWPPPLRETTGGIRSPVPDPSMSLATTGLLLLSGASAFFTDRAARRMNQMPLRLELTLTLFLSIGAMVTRVAEFQRLRVAYNHNAYGSAVWGILGLHSTLLYAGCVMLLVLGVWTWFNRVDHKHAFDVTLACLFWYGVVAVWLPCWFVVYWSPGLLT